MVDTLILEPFYGGSHKQLIDILVLSLQSKHVPYDLLTLPAKKWHWKARTSALSLFSMIDLSKSYRTIFCSSVLNLCELIGLLPALSKCKKIVYFHENQLNYPVQKQKERDFQYAYNQILSALTANVVIFNSEYNMKSFISKVDSSLKLMPSHKPKKLTELILPKCRVLYFPILADQFCFKPACKVNNMLQIVWAHRWEHDKNPEEFFEALIKLKKDGFDFQVTIMGEQFSEVPSIFHEAKTQLGSEFIKHWGFVEDKANYYSLVSQCDVAVSTALHEFFGVFMLEATHLGCFPLCPSRLVYPEIFPLNCLYNTKQQLYKRLKQYCKHKGLVKEHYKNADFNLERFSWEHLESKYVSLF